MANKNIPQIRFIGFDGEWRLLVLGAYSEIYRGGSPRPIDAYLTTSSNGINWIKIGDVNKESKYITTTQERIIEEGVINSRKVYSGDLILSNSMSFGRPYILGINGCIHDGWLVIQNYHNIFDKEYLYYSLAIPSVLNQYKKMAAGSSVKNLNKDIVSEVVLPVPSSKCEQTRIASLFTAIDKQISCSEAKLEKLRIIKKTLLKKMFASQGEKTPQIRFKGFDGEWEEKKLSDISSFETATIPSKAIESKNYVGTENMRQLCSGVEEFKGSLSTSDIKEYRKNDILLSNIRPYLQKCWLADRNGGCSSDVIVIRSSTINPFFLYRCIAQDNFFNYVMSAVCGSKMPRGDKKHIALYSHYLPISDAEQTRIATLFTALDKQISVQEEKTEKLKAVKKTLLKKMFV